ncbi:MAG: membrane protein insertase YidC [Isosphaeraceae bacterium]|nr:membrane protein insertase YidC [Isosphaeraceae bacterium]
MSTEKRLILFLILAITSMWGMQFLLSWTGMLPKPTPPVAQQNRDATEAAPTAKVEKREAEGAPPALAAAPKDETKTKEEEAQPEATKPEPVPRVEPDQLVMGSTDPQSGYNLKVQLTQDGAGVESVASAWYEAERVEGQKKKQPLLLIQPDLFAESPSFALELLRAGQVEAPNGAGGKAPEAKSFHLDEKAWEVVREGEGGPIVRSIKDQAGRVGQEVRFRTTVPELGVEVTKTYRLFQGQDGFTLAITFASPETEQPFRYRLEGPHGIPIEGEWYTGTFRDVFVAQVSGGSTKVETQTADTVAKYADRPERYQSLPLKFAGVENQYFAVFLEPDPVPTTDAQRWDYETIPIVIHEHPAERYKSDVSVAVISRELRVGPNAPITHVYRIFAGPKTLAALAPYGAEELASYRKGQLPILGPLGSKVGRYVIAPLLEAIHGVIHNYGIAIIILVILIRLVLFPLSRKQAIMAKKMQDLQPLLNELKEKYKDDKERFTREMLALQRRHGVNMFGGCLPALIQIPIFIGLWQALNNSVALRHARFLWIDDLAAPDKLFKFPFDMPSVPLIGYYIGPYFNILPLISAALFFVHTKLFSPPATTPEQEQTQKMMKFMMIFMTIMLYRVPAGLGIYFITNTTWALCERLLLPKTFKLPPIEAEAAAAGAGKGAVGKSGDGASQGWLARKLEKILEEAAKDPTVRNKLEKVREQQRSLDRDRDSGPSGPRPRPKPGKRR